jgi:hypothetical protein
MGEMGAHGMVMWRPSVSCAGNLVGGEATACNMSRQKKKELRKREKRKEKKTHLKL